MVILLIESNPADVQYVRNVLEREGRATVEHVGTLAQATARLEHGGIDLVVMDLVLPDCAGPASLEAVNSQSPQLPVVVLTAERHESDAMTAIRHGAQDYLLKGNFEPRDLERTVRHAVERKSAELTESKLALAQQIQQRFFPARPPQYPGFEIAALCRPAEVTSGDYYDFIFFPDGTLGLVVADVSGHGFGPALLMAETRAYLRALARVHSDPGKILSIMNRILAEDTDSQQFLTMFFARLDREGPWLSYTAAGHAAYLVRPSGRSEELPSTAFPLAVMKDTVYEESPISPLEPGDLLLLVTDGVFEARNAAGRPFGIDRAIEIVHRDRHETAGEIVQNLYEAARDFTGRTRQLDDMTILVVKTLRRGR